MLRTRKGIFPVNIYGKLKRAFNHVLSARRVTVYVRAFVYGTRKIFAVH